MKNTLGRRLVRGIGRATYHLAWSTTGRRFTTIGLATGLVMVSCGVVPGMGLAVGGNAYAISGWVAIAFVGLCGYAGNRFGAIFRPKAVAKAAAAAKR